MFALTGLDKDKVLIKAWPSKTTSAHKLNKKDGKYYISNANNFNIGSMGDKAGVLYNYTKSSSTWELFTFKNTGKEGRFYIIGANNLAIGGNDKPDSYLRASTNTSAWEE